MRKRNDGTGERYLIIQADDFGMTRGVNRGIIEALEAGAITNTALLVTMPATEEAAQFAKEHPEFSVGLHLSLTNGWPVLSPRDVPSLVDEDGKLLRRPERVYPVAEPDDMVREIWAQLDRFLEFGLKLAHIDTHHKIIEHPVVRQVVFEMAERHSVPIRPLAIKEVRIKAQRRGIPVPDCYREVYFEKPKPSFPVTPSRVIDVLKSIEPGVTDLGCHIGYVDEDLAKHTTYVEGREKELEALLDSTVKATIQSEGIRLVSFDYLKAQGAG